MTNNNVLIGLGTTTIGLVAPSTTAGIPLISNGSALNPSFGTALVAGGGTGDTSFTPFAPITGGSTSTGNLLQATTGFGTSGFVLTSTGSGSLPTWQATSTAGTIDNILGDTGSITGSTVTIYANNAFSICGSTVKFVNSGTTSTLNVSDANLNTMVGNTSGNAGLIGSHNTGFGILALSLQTSGSNNTALGGASINNLLTGSGNIGVGYQSGNSYSNAESNNICIGNSGTAAESNILRIGTQGSGNQQQNKCFVAGINGVTVSNPLPVMINSSTGQLGIGIANGLAFNYTLVDDDATPYTVLATDYYISCDVADAALTLVFPNAPTTNRLWIIKDLKGASSTNNISITTVGGAVLIDGQTTYKIASNYGSIQMLFNSVSYEVF